VSRTFENQSAKADFAWVQRRIHSLLDGGLAAAEGIFDLEAHMSDLDRSIVKIGTLALMVCAVGVARAENPLSNKSAPAPLHVVLRRPPPCVTGDRMALKPPVPVKSMPAYKGGNDRIVSIPNACGPVPSDKDAAAALRRLRADLNRIQLLKEAAVKSSPR
jgi:hypothetical protein